MNKKALIVGCGLTGSIIARELAENGFEVEIVEKRDHIGGTIYDYTEEHGFLVSKYCPHAFHTDDENVYEYVNRYEQWDEYRLKCAASWDGKCVPTPFNYSAIDAFYEKDEAERVKKVFDGIFTDQKEISVVDALYHDNKDVRKFAGFLFENDYAPYTSKQWNMDPKDVDPGVLKRVPIRMSYDEGYFNDKYQIYPRHSYTRLIENLLDSEKIKVSLCIDAKSLIQIEDKNIICRGQAFDGPVIFTGAIDELFDYSYGRLPYRSLRFEFVYEEKDSYQKEAIVAYPKEKGYTRVTEYKKLPAQDKKGTVYAMEYPVDYDKENCEAFYPILTKKSRESFECYKCKASRISNLYCCGRLGDFKYYDMDDAIAEALKESKRIISNSN